MGSQKRKIDFKNKNGSQKRKIDFLLAFLVMIILLKTNCCRAALLVKSNASYECKGHLDGCWIAEDLELELDMVMNSNVMRILQGVSSNSTVTGGTGNRNQPSQRTCSGAPYGNCIANGGTPNCRNTYSCGRQNQ